jgi:hypothetical protein
MLQDKKHIPSQKYALTAKTMPMTTLRNDIIFENIKTDLHNVCNIKNQIQYQVKNITWMPGEISMLTILNHYKWLNLIQEDEY